MVWRLISVVVLLISPALAQETLIRTLVTGAVRDASGGAISSASVYLRDSTAFAVSGPDGRFALVGAATGDAVIVVAHAGFQALERKVVLGTEPVALDLTLAIAPQSSSVEVSAAAPWSPEPAPSAKLQTLDIYRTPGSDADPMRAVQMLPGVVKVDEGAGLFVRGGDVSETATYLDRAVLFHPYQYETPAGGFFGAVPPYLISGLSLSSGAFPARFGDALSGILELTGLDRPRQVTLSASLGLAAASASLAIPIGEHMGLRFSGNRSLSSWLFDVNPGTQHFQQYPSGADLNFSFYADAGSTGRFKVSAFDDRESVGVEVQQDAFTGILSSTSHNRLFSVNWETTTGAWLIQATASTGSYRASTGSGALDLVSQDLGTRIRLDLTRSVGGWILRAGADAERRGSQSEGTLPAHGGDLGGIEGTRLWSSDQHQWRIGAYAELERALGRWTLNVGARYDRFVALHQEAADPRVSVAYSVSRKQRLRLAWGIYHQAPSSAYLDPGVGNPELRAMRARHLVAGYEFGQESGPVYLRIEGYSKKYRHLPLQDALLNFNSSGNGMARGVDVFFKLHPRGPWQGWAGYSYLQALRLYTPFDDFGRYDTPTQRFRPDFDIPHTLQLVLQRDLPASMSASASVRVASGKPDTPIVGAYPTAGGYVPIFGPIMPRHTPESQRTVLFGVLIGAAATLLQATALAAEEKVYFPYAVSGAALYYLMLGLCAVPVWTICERLHQRRTHLPQVIAIHVALGIADLIVWQGAYLACLYPVAGGFEGMRLRETGLWQLLGAISIYAAMAAGILAAQANRRLQLEMRRQAELRILARDAEIRALKMLIRPHFFFNAMNSIYSLIATRPQQAQEMVELVADLMRQSLDASDADVVSLDWELEAVRTYLRVEKVRLGERLDIRIDCPEPPTEFAVPPFLLQPWWRTPSSTESLFCPNPAGWRCRCTRKMASWNW